MEDAAEQSQSERTCIVTRKVRSPDEMIRFVVSPDGLVTPDLKCKLPGRGVWVTATRAAVTEAARKQHFARGFRRPVKLPEDLADRIAEMLCGQALGLLGFAKRAGIVTTGFEKVAEAISNKRLRILLEACDGAADGRRKLEGRLKASGRRDVEIVDVFAAEQLSLALGRPNVVHAAVGSDRLAEALLKAVRKYEKYTGATGM